MSEELAQKVADLLKTDVREAAKGAADLRMKDLPGIVRKEMDECLDGKCDAIAARVIEKFPEFPKVDIPTFPSEDITKAVKEAMGGSKPTFNVEGHTAHDILDCPTCRPIVVDKLWESEEYRQKVMERICEDDACREAVSKIFKEKGYEVSKHGEEPGKHESWAARRLRERRERKPS